MRNILAVVCIIILIGVTAWVTWDLKPIEYKEVPVHDTLRLQVDSTTIIKEAMQGKVVGTYDELVSRFGKVVKKTIKTTVNDTNRIIIHDTAYYSIPFLESKDTLDYSGFDLLNEDTLKVRLKVRVGTLALLEPVNAIENTIVVEDLTVTVPPPPSPSLGDLIHKFKWYLIGIFTLGYIMG